MRQHDVTYEKVVGNFFMGYLVGSLAEPTAPITGMQHLSLSGGYSPHPTNFLGDAFFILLYNEDNLIVILTARDPVACSSG